MTDTLMPPSPADIFPGFDPSIAVAESSGALFRAEFRDWWSRRKGRALTLIVLAAGLIIVALAAQAIAMAVIVAVVALIVASIRVYRISKRASEHYWSSYASSRGLQLTGRTGSLGIDVPLVHKGDKRRYDRVLRGAIGDSECSLAHFVYTVESTDSEGHTSETDHPFTLLWMRLPDAVAQRYRGVYCRQKSLSFGALQDKLFRDRAVELESTAFGKRYSLRVLDDQDDIALYELFSPTFIDELSTTLQAFWEQQGADLVVFEPKHISDTTDLDAFCARALRIHQRYAEEFQ